MKNLLKIVVGVAFLTLCCSGFLLAASTEKIEETIYEQSYKDIKEQFDNVQSKTDYLAENLDKFQKAIETWRNATTRDAQKKGVKDIDDLLDGLNEDAIKKLMETGLGEDAVKQLEEIERQFGIKFSDKVNLWELLRRDPRKAFDYMYNLSAFERTLRKQKVFEYLEKAQGYLKKGEGYLKTTGQMVEFVQLFDPTLTDPNSPTGSLRRIGSVLTYAQKFTDEIPALGHVIAFYIEATNAFSGALDRLDKKIKEARSGSLCGQLGKDVEIKKAFEKDCPGCDCLTYLSINDEYPALRPIRGWQGVERPDVFLYFDASCHTLVNGDSFATLYRYYGALKSSSSEVNRKLANHEDLISRAIAIGKENISEFSGKFRNYYNILDDEKNFSIRKILELTGGLKDSTIVTNDGKAEYRIGSNNADEFEALCFFKTAFRIRVEELIQNYANRVPLRGQIRPKDNKSELGGLKIIIGRQEATVVRCTANLCTYEHHAERNVPFDIRVIAKGYKEFYQDGYRVNELFNTIPDIYLESSGSTDTGESVSVRGEIHPKDGKSKLSDLKILINNENAQSVRCEGIVCTYKHPVKKNEPFEIKVSADGFEEFRQDGYKADEQSNVMPAISLETEKKDVISAQNAAEKTERAKSLAANGKIADAVSLISEVMRDNPQDTEAKALYAKWKKVPSSLNDNVFNIISVYLQQFDDTCLGQVISIGTPAQFKDALSESNVTIKHSPDEPPRLVTFKAGLFSAPKNELRVPFDPANPKPNINQKDALYHESIHQIEALHNAIRDNKQAGAERNTEYTYEVVLALRSWASNVEKRITQNRPLSQDTDPDKEFRILAEKIHTAESNWKPDKELAVWVGFKVDFDEILKLYLSGKCGPELKTIAEKYVSSRKPDPEACTYQYTDWGPCDEKTKKKTRKVTSKTPANCVEKEKPILEETCTPAEKEPNAPKTPETKESGSIIKPEPAGSPGKQGTVSSDDSTKLSFSGTVPDIWEGGNHDKGCHFKRAEAKTGPGSEICKWTAGVNSEVWGDIDPSFAPRSESEILKKLEEVKTEHKRWSREATIKPFALGDFKGYFLETKVKFRSGSGSPLNGYRNCGVEAHGNGYVMKGNRVVELKYAVYGGGCFDDSHRAFLESQASAAQSEARSIIASLRLVENGAFTKVPHKGLKLDGSDTPKVVLTPSQVQKLKVGEVLSVKAMVENAKAEDAPFSYSWAGEFEGKADADTVRIKTSKPGSFTLSVTVDGARCHVGSASLQYEVADFKVKVERVPPSDQPVPMGVELGFRATLTSDGKPASGKYVYRWQPHPEVTFNKLDSSDPGVSAVFPRPGREKVWVQVLEEQAGSLVTLAESEQLEVEVISPRLEISFSPKEPYVGEEVKATLTVQPDLKEIDFRWLPLPANGRLLLQSQNGREITFYLKDDKPLPIKVLALVPHSGEDLGEVDGTIQARKYTVAIQGPRFYGPPPQVWKEGTGLVEAPRQVAVHQIVEFSNTISPAPKSSPVTHYWSVSAGPCSVSNPLNAAARVTASGAGTCTLDLTLKDKHGVILGEATTSYAVTISESAVEGAKKKVKDAEDVNKKIIQAKAEWDQGDVAKAMSTFDQAKTLAPNDPEVKSTVDAYAAKKDRIDASMKQAREQARLGKLEDAIAAALEALQENPGNKEVHKYIDTVKQVKAKTDLSLQQVGQLIDASEFNQAQAALIPIKNAFPYYPPVQKMDHRLGDEWQKWDSQVKAALGQVSMASERRDFKEALEIIEGTRKKLKLLPSHLQQLSDKESYCRQMEARKEEARRLFKAGEAKLKNCDYDGALSDFKKGFAVSENLWNINKDDTQNRAEKLAAEAHEKKKQLEDHLQVIREASKLEPHPARIKDFENGLQHCGEARMLQPQNSSLPRYEAELQSKLLQARKEQETTKKTKDKGTAMVQVAGPGPSTGSSILAGKWSLNANNFLGALEFRGSDANLQGVLTIERGNENLRDIRFDGNTLVFTRPISGATQVYTGRLSRLGSGKLHLEGTFSQESDRSDYEWFADLTDAVPIQQTTPTVQPENHAVQQGANIGGIRIKASSFPNLMGQWKCKKYCPAGAEGGYANIKQGESRQLHFTNEGGGTSEGRFVDQNTVIATQWGDLRGVIKEGGRSIHWDNGTVWERR